MANKRSKVGPKATNDTTARRETTKTTKTEAKTGRSTRAVPERKAAAAPRKATRTEPARAPVTPPVAVDAAERVHRIAIAAYLRAERRGFAPGGEQQDWILAEREVDAQIATTTH